MKNQNILFWLLLLTVIIACCHKKTLSKQPTINNSSNSTIVNNNNKNEFLKFEAHYLHTTKALYEEVKIKDGKISYTLSKKVKENQDKVTDQNNNNLNTKEADLTEQDVDSLISKIDK